MALGLTPKPGMRPLPWPWTPYCLPFSEPMVMKSIMSWYCDSPSAGSVLVGNWRSVSPLVRLGPKAPEPAGMVPSATCGSP